MLVPAPLQLKAPLAVTLLLPMVPADRFSVLAPSSARLPVPASVAPVTEKVMPVRLLAPVMVCVPPLMSTVPLPRKALPVKLLLPPKLRVLPEATLKLPVWVPADVVARVPLCTSTVPVLLKVFRVALVVPVPPDFWNRPALLKVPMPPTTLVMLPSPVTLKVRVAWLVMLPPSKRCSVPAPSQLELLARISPPAVTCFWPAPVIVVPPFTVNPPLVEIVLVPAPLQLKAPVTLRLPAPCSVPPESDSTDNAPMVEGCAKSRLPAVIDKVSLPLIVSVLPTCPPVVTEIV